MSKIIDDIAKSHDVNLLFNYIPNQIELAKTILNLCNKETQSKIYFNVLGANLREFIAIMNACDLIIGNDGGAINIAKALNKPSFIIFSPWIDKKGWATFEDGVKHVSVHLKDFKSEYYGNKTAKEMKKQALDLYEKFTPNLIIPQLENFLKIN
jgi:heptosyltransferase-2